MVGRSINPVQAGQKFGSLTALFESGRANDGHKLWTCKCECGSTAVKQTNNLRSAKHQSCGCVGKKVQVESHSTHGMRSSPEYSSWVAAKNRCHTPTSKDFYRYGAIGIVMSPEWRDSFEVFYADMGARPPGTSLDRFPNQSGNYETGNCRWATPTEQNRNKKNSILFEWRGAMTPLAEIGQALGISYGATFQRMKRGKLHEPA